MGYGRARVRAKYTPRAEKLMDQVREVLRYHHYSLRTEETYCDWIVRFIRFHGTRHPKEMGKTEVEAFLSHLASVEHVAKSTQNQALNALLFLYRHVLDLPERMDKVEAVRSRRPKKMPTVLTKDEVAGSRKGHPARTGVPRAQRRAYHNDLYARHGAESERDR